MKVKLVTVEPWRDNGTQMKTIWQGQAQCHCGIDFEVDLPRDLALGVLSKDKQLRIVVIPE